MDATMKLARQYFLERNEPERVHFIARQGSFHGTTIGSMALTGKPQPRAQFEPLIPQNVSFVSACHPYRNQRDGETVEEYVHRLAEELDREFQRVGEGRVCAFVAETVSGSVSVFFFFFFFLMGGPLTTKIVLRLYSSRTRLLHRHESSV
jgi:adenosylmethionine-8-amino-7-oxononanoate aminotransferase